MFNIGKIMILIGIVITSVLYWATTNVCRYNFVIEKKTKCAPCPPCGRCPEPQFSCKKVPNYKNMDETKLPGFLPRLANAGTHY